jgi:hypothetical protein
LAPEDLIGVPQIVDGVSRFLPAQHDRQAGAVLSLSRRIERLLA